MTKVVIQHVIHPGCQRLQILRRESFIIRYFSNMNSLFFECMKMVIKDYDLLGRFTNIKNQRNWLMIQCAKLSGKFKKKIKVLVKKRKDLLTAYPEE